MLGRLSKTHVQLRKGEIKAGKAWTAVSSRSSVPQCSHFGLVFVPHLSLGHSALCPACPPVDDGEHC